MNFKKTFLSLTQWTIPHGFEESIAHLLPKGVQKDGCGNYFITVGENSTTLFTCHLDTVSKRDKVKHVIEGNIIKTDGTTILGGDNKAGVCILMYLIEQQVPGTYYFFVGEECGTIGSRWALQHGENFFKKFKRAVAYDRRNQGSIITYQRGRRCCSDEFADALSKEFEKHDMVYHRDNTGVYTDTAVFVNVIQECTNLSAGVVGEHTNSEYIDIEYCEAVAKASALIDWENLPSIREAKEEYYYNSGNYNYNHGNNYYHGRNYGTRVDDYRRRNKYKKNKRYLDPEEEEDEEDFEECDFNTRNFNRNFNRHYRSQMQHDKCCHCEGDGSHACDTCGGNGCISCDECDSSGQHEIKCSKCADKQSLMECDMCFGEGFVSIQCKKCKGKGELGDCETCYGKGDVECIFCDGTGFDIDIDDDDVEDEFDEEEFDEEEFDEEEFEDGFDEEEEDEEVAAKMTIYDNDDDSSDYSMRGSQHMNNSIDSFENDRKDYANFLVVRQPNGLYAVFNNRSTNFTVFNLLETELQNYLRYTIFPINSVFKNIELKIHTMIQAGVNDEINQINYLSSDDGLARWRYCLNEFVYKVNGESYINEAHEEIKKFIYKHGEKVESRKSTRRGKKNKNNSPFYSNQSIIESYKKCEDKLEFIKNLKDSRLEEFIDAIKKLPKNERMEIFDRILEISEKTDLNKGNTVYQIMVELVSLIS
jgi:hypothetical protein